jgi:hypothetical protein
MKSNADKLNDLLKMKKSLRIAEQMKKQKSDLEEDNKNSSEKSERKK